LHRHAVENLEQADALLFGRVTYELMRSAWRPPTATEARLDWMEPFAQTINAAKKYVVSSTLEQLDWNAELLRGDLGEAVLQLKRESGKGLFVGGVKLPLALTELGLIDEYEFVVHPRLALCVIAVDLPAFQQLYETAWPPRACSASAPLLVMESVVENRALRSDAKARASRRSTDVLHGSQGLASPPFQRVTRGPRVPGRIPAEA